MLALYENVGLL
jgi:hypothetical protein